MNIKDSYVELIGHTPNGARNYEKKIGSKQRLLLSLKITIPYQALRID